MLPRTTHFHSLIRVHVITCHRSYLNSHDLSILLSPFLKQQVYFLLFCRFDEVDRVAKHRQASRFRRQWKFPPVLGVSVHCIYAKTYEGKQREDDRCFVVHQFLNRRPYGHFVEFKRYLHCLTIFESSCPRKRAARAQEGMVNLVEWESNN